MAACTLRPQKGERKVSSPSKPSPTAPCLLWPTPAWGEWLAGATHLRASHASVNQWKKTTKTYGLTSPGVWGWILMAVSGTWVNDHLIWMSSLFSSMWNSIYENKPPRNSYWVAELITWALISSYVHASVPCTCIFYAYVLYVYACCMCALCVVSVQGMHAYSMYVLCAVYMCTDALCVFIF